MKNVGKTIVTLVLIIVFLIACMLLIVIGYTGAWLHTYQAFTAKTEVADVTISEQKHDDKGDYVDVEYTPIQTESALVSVIAPNNGTAPTKKDTQKFKLYGDVVYIGGPIIKFKDGLILLNFKTIYKIGKIYARYDLDNAKEIARTPDIASSYDLNGGIADWKNIYDAYNADTFMGKIYKLFIETPQISSPGMFVNNKVNNYKLYITNTGFMWELQ